MQMLVSVRKVCNQNKKAKQGRYNLTEYQAGAPMERKGTHGHFGASPKNAKRYEYVFMLVDQFNKQVECIPLPSQTAEVTTQAVVNGFFSRFGTSFEICFD